MKKQEAIGKNPEEELRSRAFPQHRRRDIHQLTRFGTQLRSDLFRLRVPSALKQALFPFSSFLYFSHLTRNCFESRISLLYDYAT
jgi:hypothetical protein